MSKLDTEPTPPDYMGVAPGCLGFIIGGIFSLLILFVDSIQEKFYNFFCIDLGLSDGSWKIIVIILIIIPPIIIPTICLLINFTLNKTIYKTKFENRLKEYNIKLEKYNLEKVLNEQIIKNGVPETAKTVVCNRSSLIKMINNTELYVWIKDDKLCFANKYHSIIIKLLEIHRDDILHFLKQNRKIYNEIITSKDSKSKKEEITLEFINNNKYEQLFFHISAYDILKDLIPEKEIQFVNNENNSKLIDNCTTVYEKLRELSRLKEEGILTDEEFTEKKKKLLIEV
ncbi:SHOCT domain-containing protein [Clostridium senegalense]